MPFDLRNINQPKLKKIAFAFIFILALILGLPYSDGRSSYAYWELIRDMSVVKSLFLGHLVFLGPVSSLGNFYFPPAYYYLAYPFARLLNFAPFSLAVASLFFTLATLVLSFFVIKKWWRSDLLAFTTIFFMAVSILNIQLEKYGSNPNFIPFFSLLFFYALQQLMEQPANWRFVALLATSFAIITQLHAVPMVAMPVILLLILINKKIKIKIKSAGLFIAITILLYSPYLFYELTHKFSNFHGLFYIARGHNTGSQILFHFIQYFGFWISPWLSIHTFFDIASLLGTKFYVLFSCALLGIIPVLHFNLKHPNYILDEQSLSVLPSVKTVISYWLVVPSLILLLPIGATNNFQIYYFFIFSPLIFFLMALGLVALLNKGLHLLSSYLVLVFIIFQIVQIYLYNQFVLASKI